MQEFIEVTATHNGVEHKIVVNKSQIVKIKGHEKGSNIYFPVLSGGELIYISVKEVYSDLKTSLGL
jgi:hypothetical protein